MNSRRSGVVSGVSVMALAIALSGCDQDPIQRDVYAGLSPAQALEQCAIDWGSADLCKEITDAKQTEAARQQYTASSGGSHGGGAVFFIQGPGYPYGDRSVMQGSNRIVPASALSSTSLTRPISVSTFSQTGAFRSGISTATAASRGGGFGATGHAAAAASSGGGQ